MDISNGGQTMQIHPWQSIQLSDYEAHMSMDDIRQLQTLNDSMREQLQCYRTETIIILGVCAGNGLEHVDTSITRILYGVDINTDYLRMASLRHHGLSDIFVPLACNVAQEAEKLPHAQLVIANLFVEYIGYEAFKHAVTCIDPSYVSLIIQQQTGDVFVSTSPYQDAFSHLQEILHPITEEGIISALKAIDYCYCFRKQMDLPNHKYFVRLDFKRLD
jgi:hypothetical protein